MKTVSALFALLLSAQAAANCADIPFEPVIPNGLDATESEMREARKDVVEYVERRKAYLDCLRPAPFVQERVVIELEDIADDFNRERERFLDRDDTVAAN